jgi:hypothetical protein
MTLFISFCKLGGEGLKRHLDSWMPSFLISRQEGPIGQANFAKDFTREAVLQFIERGCPFAEAAALLGISKCSLYEWRSDTRSLLRRSVMTVRPLDMASD